MKTTSFLPALLALTLACAHGGEAPRAEAPPQAAAAGPGAAAGTDGPSPSANGRLAGIREEVEALLTAEGEALWVAWTAGKPPEIGPIVARHEALFTPETLAFVKRERDRAQGDERRALSLLQAFLLGEELSRGSAASSGRLAAAPSALSWEGKAVPASSAGGLLARERDPVRRVLLEKGWLDAERRRAPAVQAHLDELGAVARRLGYPSLLAAAAELRLAAPERLAALAEAVLAGTDATYRAILGELARTELGIALGELHGRDLPRLLRAGEDVHAYPASRFVPDAQATLASLGLELEGRPGVVLDLSARPGKDPRALALPVRVPDGVRVAFAPSGSIPELRGLLHELGAAVFYTRITTPSLELRRLGGVTSETWAELFADLASDPGWLTERAGLEAAQLRPLVRASAARRLHEARTQAARILVEVARSRLPANRAGAAAKPVLERAFGRPIGPEELELFILERDPLLESADALRASLLAADAQALLASRSPKGWWAAKESGSFLGAVFADGSRLDPEALSGLLGAAALDASALEATTRARAEATGLRVPQSPKLAPAVSLR